MADDRGTVHRIAWQDVFPATILLSTLRLAVNFRALLFATVGFVAMTGGWWVIGKAFPTPNESELGRLKQTFTQLAPWSDTRGDADLQRNPDPATVLEPSSGPSSPVEIAPPPAPSGVGDSLLFSPLVHAWNALSMPFVQLMNFRWTFTEFIYLLVTGLWSLAVWSFFGGAITRMAAVSLAREEQVTMGQAVSFATSKWASYFTAPLFPLLGVVLLSLPLVLIGLLLRFNVGVVIAGILWPLPLLAGIAMAVLLLGLLFGWPLMWGTISTEGTDAFDALSRSYAYTFQRPLHYLLYAVLAAVLGMLGTIIVSIFADKVVDFSNWGVSWGSGGQRILEILHPAAGGSISPTGSALIRFWIGCVEVVAVGFAYSYLWTASTAIYFLLRRQVDSAETDEVYMPEQEQLYGMPPIKNDAAGVPAPADDATVASDGGHA